jgi:hypothetical protein
MPQFRLSNERYEEIKEIIVNMYEAYQINTIPISGFEIAHKMGIEVIPYSEYDVNARTLLMKKSEDGVVVETMENKFYIFYNDKMGKGRIK